MSDKDINIHIKAKNAEQAKRQLNGVADSTKKVGTSAKEGSGGVKQMGDAVGKTKGRFTSMMGSIAKWSAAVIGFAAVVRGFTAALRANMDAMKEHGEIAVRQQQKLLRLQFLGGFFKEHPDARKEVEAFSEFGARPFEEVADAWYNLRSKSGSLSSGTRKSILTEALEMGRTDPSMPLDTLVDMFSLYSKKTGQTDANRVQNVLQQTITEAGGSGRDVASHMPRFLPIGMAGGLSGAESAGLWAYATTQTGQASVATTGLKALFMGLQGKGTPESAKIMRKFGISGDMDFFQKIDLLSNQFSGGQFNLGHAEQLAGREGADILLSLLNDPAGLTRTIDSVTAADRGDIDITGSMLSQLFSGDEAARLEEQIRRGKVKGENIKGGGVKALRWKNYRQQLENRMRESGRDEWSINTRLWFEDRLSGLGWEPGQFQEVNGDLIQGIQPIQ